MQLSEKKKKINQKYLKCLFYRNIILNNHNYLYAVIVQGQSDRIEIRDGGFKSG
jgi:metal-responsive CopG/Arc/MetJ family transcriptional regulator